MQRWLEEEQKGPNLQGLGMSNSYHGEPYIPADIFNVSPLQMMPGTPTQLSGTPTVQSSERDGSWTACWHVHRAVTCARK